MRAPHPARLVEHNFEDLPQIVTLAFWGPKRCLKKLGVRPRDPHGQIRAGILCRIPVLKSQMVGWRPIWWQKGVIWGPLGFRAALAHPWAQGGGVGGSQALKPRSKKVDLVKYCTLLIAAKRGEGGSETLKPKA